ncbi:MAG: CDP-alcohol phosphatidyltransferase family protein [Armatimonadota bacterium]|nr:CDP-alcohol phosphatidyltransferase family protein [Armatimonadota bacterium]
MSSTDTLAPGVRKDAPGPSSRPSSGWELGYWLWVAYRLAAFCVPVCTRLGVRPNLVTVVASVTMLAGLGLLASGTAAGALGGALLMHVYYVLDALDGDLARATGRSSVYGTYLDDLNGHLMPPLLFAALGVHVYLAPQPPLWALGPDGGRTACLLLGGVAALATAQHALAEMRMREALRALAPKTSPAPVASVPPPPSGALGRREAFLRHLIGRHLVGMDGTLLPALVVAALWRRLDVVLLVMAPVSLGSLLWHLTRAVVLLRRADRDGGR